MKRKIISLFLAIFLLAELPLAVQAAEPIAPGDFIITTDEAASSCSFAYNALTISAPGTYTVSMAEGISITDDRIVIDAEGVTLILDNLHILDECSSLTLNQDAAIRAVGTVTLVTESDGSSVLEPAVEVLTGKTMTFLGGEMTAIGAKGAYGDSDYGKNGIRGNLIMQSGSLTVCGGDGGHGIYGNVTVNGGTLTATGGSGVNGGGGPIKDLVLAADAYAEPITLTATWTLKTEVTVDSTVQIYTYNTQPHGFILEGTPAEGYTVEYYVDEAWTAQAPIEAGSYNVQISRAEDDTYQSFSVMLEHGLIIRKADPQISAPTAKDGLIYDGTPQSLIEAGSTDGGRLQYRLESGEWSEELPTAVKPGQYTIYYRVVGDRNYSDGSEALLTAEIKTLEQTCPKDDTCPMEPYRDAGADCWYHDGIHYCLTHGLMEGYSTTTFDPEGTTTRAMLVTVLWRLEHEPSAADTDFTDVADEAWYARAIAWAQENGIVNGFPDGTFRPDAGLTREQAAVILQRYAAYKGFDTDSTESLDRFTDGDAVGLYAEDAMSWACEIGLMRGKENNVLDPHGSTMRSEIATLMMRFCNRFFL